MGPLVAFEQNQVLEVFDDPLRTLEIKERFGLAEIIASNEPTESPTLLRPN